MLMLLVLLICVLCLLIAAGNELLLRDGVTIREEVYRCQMLSMAAGYMGAWSEVVAYSGAI